MVPGTGSDPEGGAAGTRYRAQLQHDGNQAQAPGAIRGGNIQERGAELPTQRDIETVAVVVYTILEEQLFNNNCSMGADVSIIVKEYDYLGKTTMVFNEKENHMEFIIELAENNFFRDDLLKSLPYIADVLLHEMVHVYCFARGMFDKLNGETVEHGKFFQKAAEEHGLTVLKDETGRIGTQIKLETIAKVIECFQTA